MLKTTANNNYINFQDINENSEHNILLKYFPNGTLWQNKMDLRTNLGKLIWAYARINLIIYQNIQTVANEIFLDTTINMIDSFLDSVGLPNDCISIDNKTLKEIKPYILALIVNEPVITKGDFEKLGRKLGVNVSVFPGSEGSDSFPMPVPLKLSLHPHETRFTTWFEFDVVAYSGIEFPLSFPIPFSLKDNIDFLCIFEAFKPANVQHIYKIPDGTIIQL